MTAIVVIVVALAAGGAGYYFGAQAKPGAANDSTVAVPTPMNATAPTPAANTPVVAKVDGSPIYQSEVDAFIADLGDRARQVPPADLQTQIVDRLIDIKLAGNKAHSEKLEQDPTVARRLYNGQETTLAEAFLEKTAQAQITDDVLKAKYDELVKQATPPEEVRARHILVKTEAEAKDIIKQLDKGADFEKLAKERSTDPGSGASGGDLGYFTKDKMVPEFADAAFKLDKGKYTATPVHSQYGWHVIEVIDKRSQPLPPFDQVKPQINNLVLQEDERKVEEGLHKGAKIEKFNADGSPIVEPAPSPAAPADGSAPAPAAESQTPPPAPATTAPAPAASAPAPKK
jgi:peptidyl-prolyl cis-trans isomerase C